MTLYYVKHLLILTSMITGCITFSEFDSLIGISVVITSSAAAIKICLITAGTKTFKSIIKKRSRSMIK